MPTLEAYSHAVPRADAANHCERLAAAIGSFVVDQLDRIAAAYFPHWRIPGVFAGHQVGSDVRADVAFTLGLLHEFGLREMGGHDLAKVIAGVLRPIDGRRTNTFWSYRVAETLARFGGSIGSNELTAGWSSHEYENLLLACDSTASVPELEAGKLPRNYAAVLARCEYGRVSLGLTAAETPLQDMLIRRVEELMSGNPEGYLDDSESGSARYDIYTADLYLFSEPFACRLSRVWERGARNAIRLVEQTVTPSGAAFPWGRSSGALAACMTMELGALALRDGLCADPGRWLTLVRTAFENIPDWFSNEGVIAAHRRRSTYGYRGIHRWLQMTFDCLGKLVWTANSLRDAAVQISPEPVSSRQAFPEQDVYVRFDERTTAGVWCYRRGDLSFVLPISGATLNDYLPAPHHPGLFEVPVEADLPSGVPFAFFNGKRFVAGHLPLAVEKLPDGIVLRYEHYPQGGRWDVGQATPALPGSRTVTYRVQGRSITVEEDLQFDVLPNAVGIQLTETLRRPLAVNFECESEHASAVIETAGIKEYRSFWAELPRVHQLDLQPAKQIRFRYSVAPLVRVLSSHPRHHYHRTIYDQLKEQVVDGATMPACHDLRDLPSSYKHWDVFHLHWPEIFGPDLSQHRKIIASLAAASVPIVWTQHNLETHSKDERFGPVFEAWAAAARGVIHHSHWGQEQSLARYRFRRDAIHRVIPHPHFGGWGAGDPESDRARVEAEFGLVSGRLRLGIFGAPRAEKRVDAVMRAFLNCGRDDLELLVFSLAAGETAPVCPRLVARRYEFVPRTVYSARLHAVDVFVLPFESGMLTTGQVGDIVGHGIPALVSDWPYLAETLGDAGIRAGHSEADLTESLRALSWGSVHQARQACQELQGRYAPKRVAEMTLELLDAVRE